ncbi:MAG: signal peptide peptidase SppA [Candidatus Auribacterota bacterium]|nr:signal peptide peptidase SppA [Candidatus Auribacterota bacterium]
MEDKIIVTPLEKKKRIPGWVWAVVTVFFIIVLAFWTLGIGLVLLIREARTSFTASIETERQYNEIYVSGSGSKKIVLIPLRGLIMDSGESPWRRMNVVREVSEKLRKAGKDESVAAVILQVDSPGGGVTASDILADKVRKFRDSGKIIVVSMEDLAASGAYYVSAPSNYIMAHPTTITGSIGVLMQGFNIQGLLEKVGVEDVTFKSGVMKDILSPAREMTEEERKVIQRVVDYMYRRFISVVAEGRNLSLEQVEAIADARIFTSDEAVLLGLVDSIGFIDDTIEVTKKLAELEEARIIRYKTESTLSELLLMRIGQINPLAEVMNSKFSEVFSSGGFRLMYLWKVN